VDGGGAARILGLHEGAVTGVTWMQDSKAVVSSSALDQTVRIWRLEGGEPYVLQADAPVYRPAVAQQGEVLMPETAGLLRILRPDGTCDRTTFPAMPEGLFTAASSPDGQKIALTSMDGTVRVYPARGSDVALVLRGHEGVVEQAAFSPDATELATASVDGTARVTSVDWLRLRDQLRTSTTACLPSVYRRLVLGESTLDADRRLADCHRAHGREPPATVPANAAPPSASIDPALEVKKG
jgi:WD40 repeat protein